MSQPQYVSYGINRDCETLLHKFVQTESVRYEQFAAIWRQMNFTLVRCGLKTQTHVKEFMEDTFLTVTSFFLPPYGFQVRVGALYLLYAFYYTQTEEPKIKIRITLNQWPSVLAFHEEVKRQQHFDADYIFRKLRMEKAFLFVATPAKVVQEKNQMDAIDIESNLDRPSVLSDVFEGEPLEQLQRIHDKYQSLKCAISGSDVVDRSLDMVKEPIAEQISRVIDEHEEWRKKKRELSRKSKQGAKATYGSDEDSDSDDGDDNEASSRRKRIAEIKKRSFAGVSQVSRSRRHRQNISDSPEKSPKKKVKRGRKRKQVNFDEMDELSNQEASTADETISSVPNNDIKLNMPVLVEGENETTIKTRSKKRKQNSERGSKKVTKKNNAKKQKK
ncbi:snRNA-activating protein complex subunit 1-like [Saccoglossus kowalevskii]|uniref:snRNA-activating protein complex subunit 1-like n=1 Tax=Saccoglossus kowalevskii TaxID=10224 RepID=A0ABM0N0D8_SACKO|nr:PREDICTED: snRNA-activating protein complex subunit 1-like [Saccoglossus kowalevskii]